MLFFVCVTEVNTPLHLELKLFDYNVFYSTAEMITEIYQFEGCIQLP